MQLAQHGAVVEQPCQHEPACTVRQERNVQVLGRAFQTKLCEIPELSFVARNNE